jgi:hypothetical protein
MWSWRESNRKRGILVFIRVWDESFNIFLVVWVNIWISDVLNNVEVLGMTVR